MRISVVGEENTRQQGCEARLGPGAWPSFGEGWSCCLLSCCRRGRELGLLVYRQGLTSITRSRCLHVRQARRAQVEGGCLEDILPWGRLRGRRTAQVGFAGEDHGLRERAGELDLLVQQRGWREQ